MQLPQYPRYDDYVDSGFDWIKNVPGHWTVSKLGSCLSPVSKKNHGDKPLLSITREAGVIERDVEDQDSNHNFIPDDLSNYKLVRKGQFAMNKMKAWQGSYGVSEHTGIVSPAYYVFDFAKPFDPRFFNIAIRSKLYVSYFGSASDGVRIGQWDLNKTRMKAIPFLVPPLEEQQAIARFLDEKIDKIDQAVKIKEGQIALLRERKQIIIQEAVTKGLNPAAAMKDSGIDWIGEIPAHWGVMRIKNVAGGVKTGTTPPSDLNMISDDLEGVNWFTPGDVREGGVFGEAEKKVSHAAISRGYVSIFPENSIYFVGIGGTLGRVNLSLVAASCNQQFNVILPSRKVEPYFCLRWLLSYREQVFALTNFTTMPIRNQTGTKNIPFACPPISEQKEIVKHIDREVAKVEAAVELKEHQIEALKEYKATLINAAVTGKIKVI